MSYVTNLEQVVADVSDWATQLIEDVIAQLSPDGVPFAMDERPEQEQVAEYLSIVGDPAAWADWINERAELIISKLEAISILPEDIATIKPFEIAGAMAMEYSARMEKLLNHQFSRPPEPTDDNQSISSILTD